MSGDGLVPDVAAVGGLSAPVAVRSEGATTVWRRAVPPQETKVGPGTKWVDPLTGRPVGALIAIDVEDGWLEIARANPPTATALVPDRPIPNNAQRDRLAELAAWVIEQGIDSPDPRWRAARDLIRRVHPRV